MKKSAILILATMIFASQNLASEFIEALRGGEKNGDINLLFDYTRDSSVPKNRAYLATSFGLYYKSAFYEYFRLHLGFRGALALWELNKKTQNLGGRGDSARYFWSKNIAMVARSYLEYFDGDTSVRAGRIEHKTDMIDKHFDGVWISNKSAGWLLVDAIYINQVGRVLDREMSGFEKFKRFDGSASKYGGGYYLGLDFEVKEWLHLKIYGLTSPQIYSFIAGKASVESEYFNASAGYVGGIEHQHSKFTNQPNKSHFSHLVHIDLGGQYDSQYGLFHATLGYRNTQGKAGIGSLDFTGNSFNPFFYFSGDALHLAKDLQLVYGKLGFKVDFLDVYLVYGYNFFNGVNTEAAKQNSSQGEVNFYFDWKFSDFSSVILSVLNTHGAESSIPNKTNVGLMFKVSL